MIAPASAGQVVYSAMCPSCQVVHDWTQRHTGWGHEAEPPRPMCEEEPGE